MALRTVLDLIVLSGGITSTQVQDGGLTGDDLASGTVTASNVDLSDDFNFTGALQANGETILGGDLYFLRVDCVQDSNINMAAAPNSVDGFNIINPGQLVLAINQSPSSDNGVRSVTTVGTGSDGVWDRPTTRDEDSEIPIGTRCYVRNGDTYSGSMFTLTAGTLSGGQTWTLDDSLHPSNSGEPENLTGADGSKLAFDLSVKRVAYLQVTVDGVPQAPSTYHIGKGTGTGGVDQLVFETGNAPANSAAVEAIVLYRK
jgi:hypothetical protein